jgi:hypothetical protein
MRQMPRGCSTKPEAPARSRSARASRSARGRRRGVALLTVLWVIATGAIIAGGMVLDGRDAVGAAGNRLALSRASWRAAGCSAELLADIDDKLRQVVRRDSTWDALDESVRSPGVGDDCRVTLTPVGLAVDVNAADEAQLRALFIAARVPGPEADSLTDQILDWRDADEIPRRYGAERGWYTERRRFLPRNGSIAAMPELRRVGALESVPAVDELLTTEPGRVLISRAPLAVIRSLPGVNDETLVRVAVHRGDGAGRFTWAQLAPELTAASRVELMTNLLELERRSTLSPDGWILTVSVSDGAPAVTATIQLRLAFWGDNVRVVQSHSWP